MDFELRWLIGADSVQPLLYFKRSMTNSLHAMAQSIFSDKVHSNGSSLSDGSDITVLCPKNASYHFWREDGLVYSNVSLPVILPDLDLADDNDDKDGEDDGLSPTFHKVWNKTTTPIFLLFLFPLICLRSISFFTKFNSFGESRSGE